MPNDAPAVPIRRIPEDHTEKQAAFKVEQDTLTNGGKDPAYKIAFSSPDLEKAEKKLIQLGFPENAKVADLKALRAAMQDGTDNIKGVTNEKALKDYAKTLERAGCTKVEAASIAEKTLERFKGIKDGGESNLVGTPAEQMARINKAMADVLDKRGVQDGKLADGQKDKLTFKDRQNFVKDLAMRYLDPKGSVVQGDHYSCVLQSRFKQMVEGGNLANAAEMMASVVNNGYAMLKEQSGKVRTVHVDSDSFKPDKESSVAYDAKFHGDDGKRGLAGHVWDALSGQAMADLKSERAGLSTSECGIGAASTLYMAAHADKFGAKTTTGEGLFTKTDDGYEFKDDNPDARMWDMAHLSQALGGADGSVFAHQKFAKSEKPPQGQGYPADLRVTTFSSIAELREKLSKFQAKTGQSAQILVDAPYLPGGGADGHGLHAGNLSLDENQKFCFDNNWRKRMDLQNLKDEDVDRATNPENWVATNKPTIDTIIRPGTGRNPNESVDDFNKRRAEDAKRKDLAQAEEEQKRHEAERKKKEKEYADKKAEEETRLAKDALERDKLYARQLRLQKLMAEYQQSERADKNGDREHKLPVPTLATVQI